MVLASDFDKSKYFRAEDLQSEKKFRIKEVTVDEIANNRGEKEDKLIVWFTNDKRGLVLNKTTNRVLRGAFGDDVSGWKAKVIIIFPTPVPFRGKMVPGLRVRIPPPKQAAATGNGQAVAAPPQQPSRSTQSVQQQLDEFGQTQSSEKPSLSDDLDDEIGF
jgi:hypothetical protein